MGKSFVIKLIMEIYNRFTDNDGYCNAYITCASTCKAAMATDGTTVHTALKISLSKLLPRSSETLQLYRSLFRSVRVLIIDEISMVSAELLHKIDNRLKQITTAIATSKIDTNLQDSQNEHDWTVFMEKIKILSTYHSNETS